MRNHRKRGMEEVEVEQIAIKDGGAISVWENKRE
jgi:hypothetical protein